ncbi:MAG: DUF4082 domain-containing protein [Planctomycetes bacterium]|nr:DUF4082 domain-containing protein [Planctomycetota bacterium]
MNRGGLGLVRIAVSGVVVLVAMLLSRPCAGAQELPAITNDDLSGRVSGIAWNLTEGWRFTVNEDIRVMRLGVWDLSSDGLNTSHDVGLWDPAGNLLASGTVAAGTAGALVNDFRYVSITPVDLEAGHDYVIGALYVPSPMDDYIAGDSSNTFTSDPRITWNHCVRYSALPNAPLTFPTEEANYAGAFGPNFTFTPEPATLALVALGALGLLRRRKA